MNNMMPINKINKSFLTYSLIFLILVPFFGFNFFISLIGNFLLLIFLVPLLIFLIALISFNSLKDKVKTCDQCGSLSLGKDNNCLNCGANLGDINNIEDLNKASETTIEVKAEEIK